MAARFAGTKGTAQAADDRKDDYPFKLGVASGDTKSDGVILWTRLAPKPLSDTHLTEAIKVNWLIAEDPNLQSPVRIGETVAIAENAHSIHVEADGLEPDKLYYYQFEANGYRSQLGRTRTLPLPGVELEKFSIALSSCQEYSQGYFSAYRDLIAKNPDLVIHNGDYIYEAQSGSVRPSPVLPEAQTLADYRALYAHYRQDSDLREAHARFPWFVIWDDHEIVNDWGPGHYLPSNWNEQQSSSEYQNRRLAATRAFLEHMPLRASMINHKDQTPELYGRSVIGDLLEISRLDVRSYRDLPVCNTEQSLSFFNCEDVQLSERSMLGSAQEQWLYRSFGTSGCKWNCLAQTTIMAALDKTAGAGVSYETDSWDNYPANRARILNHIKRRKIGNPISLGGNIHAFYAGVVSPGQEQSNCGPPVLTELITTSITAGGGGIERLNDINNRREENPCIAFFENRFHGYTFLEFTRDRITASLRVVDDVAHKDGQFSTLATIMVDDGKIGVRMI